MRDRTSLLLLVVSLFAAPALADEEGDGHEYAPDPGPPAPPAAMPKLPPPPLRIEHPSGLWFEPIAEVQAWVTPVDLDDPERNDPIVIGDPDHREGFSIRRAYFGTRTGWKNLLAVTVSGGWKDRFDALQPAPKTPVLTEATIALTPWQALQFHLGLQDVPFGRQASEGSSSDTALWEEAMVSERLGAPTEPGLTIRGAIGPNGHAVLPETAFRYAIGAWNGGGDFTGDRDPGPRVAARGQLDLGAAWDPRESNFHLPKFGVSVGGGVMQEWALEANTTSVGADLGLRFWRLSLQGEFIWARSLPTFDVEGVPELLSERRAMGWYAQVGVMILPSLLEAAVRIDGYDDNLALDDAGDRMDLAGGLNLYLLEDRLKLQLDWVHRFERTAGYATANDSMILAVRARI